jgi:hypothetical protein
MVFSLLVPLLITLICIFFFSYISIAPFWNASTEQFVRDWRTAVVRVVVKDHKDLEYDPVIGMVTLPFKELFGQKEKVMNTEFYLNRTKFFLFININLKLNNLTERIK